MYNYVYHLVPEKISHALAFGAAWHEVLDALWKDNERSTEDLIQSVFIPSFSEEIEEEVNIVYQEDEYDIRTPLTAYEMLDEYKVERNKLLKQSILIMSESSFTIDLFDDVKYCGKIDKQIIPSGKESGNVVYLEHKTTSEYPNQSGFNSSFLKSFQTSAQVDGYSYEGTLTYGSKFKGVWVDAALVHKSQRNFKILPQFRNSSIIAAWKYEAEFYGRNIIQDLELLKESSHSDKVLKAFPRNTEHCVNKYGACPYLNICTSYPNPLQIESLDGFELKKKPWNPLR